MELAIDNQNQHWKQTIGKFHVIIQVSGNFIVRQ